MTDRELLEVAAKAAGAKWIDDEMFGCGWALDDCWWNPLTDDGDALRLAVKLEMYIVTRFEKTNVSAPRLDGWIVEPHHDNPDAATRRAIVRAAAEIGKEMK